MVDPGAGPFRSMQYSRTIMQSSHCRVERLGWRAAWHRPLMLALVSVTVLLSVELSRGDVGSCYSNNTCPVTTDCCNNNRFCGNTADYCGIATCIGGPCYQQSAEPTAAPAAHKKNSLSTGILVGIAVGAVAGLGLVFLGVFLAVACFRSHHKSEKLHTNQFSAAVVGGQVGVKTVDGRQVSVGLSISAISNPADIFIQSADPGRRLSYETLHSATNGFSVELGRGSFGVVYKGTLTDGTDIAVKQLLERQRDVKDFEAEVRTLGRINHANLVALIGFSYNNKSFFLVYEFVANKSLERWIFQNAKENPEFVLPWRTRVDILKGTAKGLAYLHEELQRGQIIVHLDIKPQNILLDERFDPKISDFGLAKLLGAAATTSILASGGTKGYMAPEIYIAAVSEKMDVYSFGIVMLEVVSGRVHEDPDQSPDRLFLPAWAIRKLLAGEEVDIVDNFFGEDQFNSNEAARLIWISLLCLQGDPSERPLMSSVLRMMEGIVDPPDLPPTLQAELERSERLICGRLPRVATPHRGSFENMIEFSIDDQSGSRNLKKGSETDTDSNKKP